jgi:hypothetical protein
LFQKEKLGGDIMNLYEDDEDEGDVIDIGYYHNGKKRYNNIKNIFEDAVLTFYHKIPTGYKRSGFFYKIKDESDNAKLMFGNNDFNESHWVVIYLGNIGPIKKELAEILKSKQTCCEIKTEFFDIESDAENFYKEILSKVREDSYL